jgi:UV DNA damage endonuclease
MLPYLQIREMLKEKKTLFARDFYQKIEEGLQNPPTAGSELNAALHVWGYFKDITDIKEKDKFNKLLDKFEAGLCEISALKNYLFKLALKYDENYLKYSYYFIKP